MKALLFGVCLFVSLPAFSGNTPKNLGSKLSDYDPSFWKKSLHLSRGQVSQIDEINFAFYSSLMAMAKSETNASTRAELLNTLILNRNNQIRNVFSHRQKSKWSKIMKKKYS